MNLLFILLRSRGRGRVQFQGREREREGVQKLCMESRQSLFLYLRIKVSLLPNCYEIGIVADHISEIEPPTLGLDLTHNQNQEVEYQPLVPESETIYKTTVNPHSNEIPGSTTGVESTWSNQLGDDLYPNSYPIDRIGVGVEVDSAPLTMSISSTRSTTTRTSLDMPIPVSMPNSRTHVLDHVQEVTDPHPDSNESSMGMGTYLDHDANANADADAISKPNFGPGLDDCSRHLPPLRSISSYRTSHSHPSSLNSVLNSKSNSTFTDDSKILSPIITDHTPLSSHVYGIATGQDLPSGTGTGIGNTNSARRTSLTPYSRQASRDTITSTHTLNNKGSTLSLRGVGFETRDRDTDRNRDIGIW
jgi:hypothetical protein